MIKNKTILLVGGGTGGHIVPVLSIYKKLVMLDPDLDICIAGGNTLLDQKFYAGVDRYFTLYTGKFHRVFTLNNIVQVFYLFFGLIQSLIILLKIRPRIIFSKAGYVSFPIIVWAKILKIPYIIHESDISMGKSNEFASSRAIKIFVGFPVGQYPAEYRRKTEFSGQILRPEIEDVYKNLYDFNLDSKKPTIFITGGSQGARNINNVIFASLSTLLKKYNLIHHVGALDYQKAINIRSTLGADDKKSYYISDLLSDSRDGTSLILSAIFQSNLVISRASATTMGEIAALSKPMIVIPYQYAAQDHQNKNAQYFARNKAAVVLKDDKNLKTKLLNEIDRLFRDRSGMERMGNNALNLFPRDGADKIAEEIYSLMI